MQIFSQTRNWVQRQMAVPADDFKQAPEPQASAGKTVAVAAGVGAGVGAVVGGGAAYHNVASDAPFFDWESSQKPLAASGPAPTDVFGGSLGQFQSLVQSQSESAASSKETLQYLSYLKFQNPKLSNTELSDIYRSLEGQLGHDNEVRSALNMISAHVGRYGSTPSQAYGEFKHYFGYESDFNKATQMFLQDQKLTDEELNSTTIQMVTRHTSTLAHLGMAKAVALGVAGGMVTGAVTGAIVGVGINLFRKIADS